MGCRSAVDAAMARYVTAPMKRDLVGEEKLVKKVAVIFHRLQHLLCEHTSGLHRTVRAGCVGGVRSSVHLYECCERWSLTSTARL